MDDNLVRCPWADGSDLMRAYHDTEWGVPLHDDRALFELLTLEGAQAGLSWRTVLNKRDAYRRAFHNFDISRVAAMGDADVAALLADPGLIRNRQKIASVPANARAALALISRVRQSRRLPLALHRRPPGGEPLDRDGAGPGAHRHLRPHEQGATQAPLRLCRLDHLLRLHAGERDGG